MDYYSDYLIPSSFLTPSLFFMGHFDSTKDDYKTGDVCIFDDNEIYMYIDNKWDKVSSICDNEKEIKEVEILPKICSRCGAPLRYHICEYCGTRY